MKGGVRGWKRVGWIMGGVSTGVKGGWGVIEALLLVEGGGSGSVGVGVGVGYCGGDGGGWWWMSL